MSVRLFISIWRNKRYGTDEFICPPDIGASAAKDTTLFSVAQPLTAHTGALLRALADEADAVWAEWTAQQKAKKEAQA